MNFTRKAIPFIAFMLGLPGVVSAQPAAIDLGTLGGTSTFASAINDSGQVVGYSELPGNRVVHAFLWTAANGMVDLTPSVPLNALAIAVSSNGQVIGNTGRNGFSWTAAGGLVDLGNLGSSSQATAVNASGQVVGLSYLVGNDPHRAFLWTAARGMIDLGTLGGEFSMALAINEDGQVVGNSTTAHGEMHAFSWTAAGGMVDIHPFRGAYASSAGAVNAIGQVIVTSYYQTDMRRAFSWTAAGGLVDLGSLGGFVTDAIDVNDSGLIVGDSLTADREFRAFSWTAAGGMVDLGTLGGSGSVANAVNATGTIVGGSRLPDNLGGHAFRWTAARGMEDLGALGGGVSGALAVNAAGQILGQNRTPGGVGVPDVYRAVVWNTRSYNFHFSGVKRPPAFNEVVAGRTAAVSFSLGGNFGLAIFDEGSPTFERVACGASAGVGPIEPTGGAPSGSVIYKPEVDRYAYATKTDRSWAGTCRSLTLRLNDGSSHVVYFSFK